MSAQIRSQVTREEYPNFSHETVSFFVYDPSSPFAGTAYDRSAWTFMGNAATYFPEIPGSQHAPVIVSPCDLPCGGKFPQVRVSNLREAAAFYAAYAEVFAQQNAIEAERREWFSVMAEAEAAEARARAILTDTPAAPPF